MRYDWQTKCVICAFLQYNRIFTSRIQISMITTTTPNIEGKEITDYLGIVTGEAIMGANIFRHFLAGIRDITEEI